ncbi:MAG: acyl-CoA thioesterase [Phycisphaerales bacterium]
MSAEHREPDWLVRITIPVAWGEMDALGHVNNVVYFRYFECARVEYLRRVGWQDRTGGSGAGFILHSVQARFRRAVVYPDTVTVMARCSALGADRLTIEHAVTSAALGGALTTEGTGIVVCYDYARREKMVMPAALREAVERLEGRTVGGEREP